MTDPTDTPHTSDMATPALDEKLGRLFRELRNVESREAPEFLLPNKVPNRVRDTVPETVAAGQGSPLSNAQVDPPVRPQFRPPRKLAAGLAAALVAAVVLAPAPQSPDELYLEIMNSNTLLTENLLVVSPTLLPELNDFDDLFEIPTSVESAQWN